MLIPLRFDALPSVSTSQFPCAIQENGVSSIYLGLAHPSMLGAHQLDGPALAGPERPGREFMVIGGPVVLTAAWNELPRESKVLEQAALMLRLSEKLIVANGGQIITIGDKPGYRIQLQTPHRPE